MEIAVRPAFPEDAKGSARYHAQLDPEHYSLPSIDTMSERYLKQNSGADAVALIAERNSEIVGFTHVRLERSDDAMRGEMLYCHITEIAVSNRYQNQGD